ncbi:MAG: outer membrane lipoprotein-sorting protein [Spirochaetaceae bacterium]|jgi:outer membrane lipoprotein-sorting protein|nr:outer membrane lipoprotein-sorting protein [Spirochaetaceae bacterium]
MRRDEIKKICMVVLALFPATLPAAESDVELLKRADGLASYLDADFAAKYTIVHSKPGLGNSVTVASVFRRDRDEKYAIIVTEPEISLGEGYLKQGDMIWIYDPSSGLFESTKSRERFRNSSASNSDFTRSTLAEDYRVESGSDERLGVFQCRVLSLLALTDKVAYPRMRIWISEDGLVRKTEEYALSGQLLRTTAIPDYEKIGSRRVPKSIVIVDAQRGATMNGQFVHEKTQITIQNPSFRALDNAIFSKQFLENAQRGGRK